MYVIRKLQKEGHDPEYCRSRTKIANKLERRQRMFAPGCFVVSHHIPYNYIYALYSNLHGLIYEGVLINP